MPNIEDFLLFAIAQAGDRYVFGSEVNPLYPDGSRWDCSELMQIAALQAGGYLPDGAANQYAYCVKMHTIIAVDRGLATRGALLFPYPRVHHVVASLGTIPPTTIEAKGAKWGVGVFSARGRFQRAALVPGFSYEKHGLLPPQPDNLTVDELKLPDNLGGWRLHADGGVFTWGRAPFYGSYPGLPAADRRDTAPFIRIMPRDDHRTGYQLLNSAGHSFRFPGRNG